MRSSDDPGYFLRERSFEGIRSFLVKLLLVLVGVAGVSWIVFRAQRAIDVGRRKGVVDQAAMAIAMYAIDHNDRLPLKGCWGKAILLYDRAATTEMAGCDGIPPKPNSPCLYIFNEAESGMKISEIDQSIAVVWEDPTLAAEKGNVLYWGELVDGEWPWPVAGPMPPRRQ